MSEKPIIFSTPMVQAILAGRKMQTRRVVKPQFPVGLLDGKYRYDGVQEGIHGIELLDADDKPTEKYFSCGKPPFVPDDVLWVRGTRIFLCVTDVRVERLQDISGDNIEQEGFTLNGVGTMHDNVEPPGLSNFIYTWDSLNAKRGFGWESNPWVWVISFERT